MQLTKAVFLSLSLMMLGGCVSTSSPQALSVPTPPPSATPELTVNPSTASASKPTNVKGVKTMTATLMEIKTAKGTIEIELYPKDAPKTVENFATLASQGYYNGLTFHRVEPGFVIQGGDPNGNGTGGHSIFGDTFEDELNPNTDSYKNGYKEGVVAMANRGPNTNGSQFFIMLADNSLPHLYTIFGKVVKGLDIVHQIQVGDKITAVTIVK